MAALTTLLGDPMTWLPIQYRGFWDAPRAFLVERNGDVHYFDAPFDETKRAFVSDAVFDLLPLGA